MRILQLHCDNIEFTPIKKEIKSAEEVEPSTKKIDEVVVAFIAVEEGDNSIVAKKAIAEIKESMKKVGCSKLLLYPYAHLSSKLASPSVALSVLKEMETLVGDLEVSKAPFGWTKSYKIQVKGHPLAENSKTITSTEKEDTTSDAVKAESKIESFWYIMSTDGKM
ncbi:MAG TPA: threonyl-tRNA synthetase editing domain-containing protein, partial [Nitrosopumilaceae archaeon]|nr:threonyl-tRNA synthetase editing domain-containing protein [Nitrosopumilaceae archaeon]